MSFERLMQFLLRPASLGKIKLGLFPVLVAGVSLDWNVVFELTSRDVEVTVGSDGWLIPTLLISAFAFIIIVDFWNFVRISKERKEMLEALQNPNVPDAVKIELARLLG